jgi:para-aminobenzoate synthetase/4-amino-4-deoxychorismate lyase
VFETMLARDGRVQALDLHLQRLGQAVSELYGARLPDGLADRVRTTASTSGEPSRVRIDAIPRDDLLDVSIVASAAHTARAVTLWPVVVPGGVGPYKWRDRRLLEALDDGVRVPLILDADELLEAGRMNVWIVEGRTLVTPPADGRLLPGVTRALVLELAPALGLDTSTEAIPLERARAADAIFVTSSIRHATSANLFGRAAGGQEHPFVARIREAVRDVEWTP